MLITQGYYEISLYDNKNISVLVISRGYWNLNETFRRWLLLFMFNEYEAVK